MIRWLLTTFIAVAVLSACWPWLRKIGIGRMPGDVTLRLFGREYPFPFMSTLVLSIVLSLLAGFCSGLSFACLGRLFVCSWGFGLSLICWWSISVAPVRGGTYFLCRPQREVSKRKRLKPLMLSGSRGSAAGSGASGICVLAHSALVTKASSAPTPHCVRRGRVCRGNHGLQLRFAGRRLRLGKAFAGTPFEMSVRGNHHHGPDPDHGCVALRCVRCGCLPRNHDVMRVDEPRPDAEARRQNAAIGF